MNLETMYQSLGISSQVLAFAKEIEDSLKERFDAIDSRAEYNQLKVTKQTIGALLFGIFKFFLNQ